MTSFAIDTGDSYEKRFQIYREKSGENFRDLDVLKSRLPGEACSILKETGRDRLNILSIGSGSGEVDFEILKMIKAELQANGYDCDKMKIFNRAVEPNEHYINAYEASISDFQKDLGGQVTFDLVKGAFEEYLKKKPDSVRFDIIHWVRSIYYVDAEQALRDCFDTELSNGGKIALVLAGADDLISHVHKMLWPNGKPMKSEPFELQDVEKILKIADKNGWKNDVSSVQYSLDVTEILDDKSIIGNLLLDFITQKTNFRETTEQQKLTDTLELMKKNVVLEDGKYLGRKSSNIVFFYK
ncbi:histamine N-methyltransferase-like [Actinia tenebrosa]|uniref:Histamine N-methyltransferase-like n=1 Tax=Actinia tenebrosa TaxID=6105 RepID=A0A6P8H567_ACTTE|nr:histamine N-methyltransferase-like [Actinia tenebrosa]